MNFPSLAYHQHTSDNGPDVAAGVAKIDGTSTSVERLPYVKLCAIRVLD
jgi:hypothetical protein